MTRKHYVMFATAMRNARPTPGNIAYTQWLRDVNAIADLFASNSAGFDRNRFMDAAGAELPGLQSMGSVSHRADK